MAVVKYNVIELFEIGDCNKGFQNENALFNYVGSRRSIVYEKAKQREIGFLLTDLPKARLAFIVGLVGETWAEIPLIRDTSKAEGDVSNS